MSEATDFDADPEVAIRPRRPSPPGPAAVVDLGTPPAGPDDDPSTVLDDSGDVRAARAAIRAARRGPTGRSREIAREFGDLD